MSSIAKYGLIASLFVSYVSFAADEIKSAPDRGKQVETRPNEFTPTNRGQPKVRISGGTRNLVIKEENETVPRSEPKPDLPTSNIDKQTAPAKESNRINSEEHEK